MSRAHKKAIRAQTNNRKRMETKKRVKKLMAKNTAEEQSDEEETQFRVPLKLVRVINEEEMIEKISEEAWKKVKELPYVISIPSSYANF